MAGSGSGSTPSLSPARAGATPHVFVLVVFCACWSIPTCWACFTDADCSLNGVCANGECACDPWWKGADCGALSLGLASPLSGYNYTAQRISSWGGQVVWDQHTQTYHLLASEFIHHCGLGQWSPNSRVIHATSSVITGPYANASEVLPPFHHNPTIVYYPTEKLYLLYAIGCIIPINATVNCDKLEEKIHDTDTYFISCDSGNSNNGESGISLWTSPSPAGPWTSIGMVLKSDVKGVWDTDTTNPSAHVQPDGSIVLAYRGCAYNCNSAEQIGVSVAPHYRGPYTRLTMEQPLFQNGAEDPFIWQDHRQNWHILYHSLEPGGGFGDGPRVGRHAYATDLNATWTVNMNTLAFDTTVSFVDGSSIIYYRRERPQLILNEHGIPTHLINGVQEQGSQQSYTVIQPIQTTTTHITPHNTIPTHQQPTITDY